MDTGLAVALFKEIRAIRRHLGVLVEVHARATDNCDFIEAGMLLHRATEEVEADTEAVDLLCSCLLEEHIMEGEQCPQA